MASSLTLFFPRSAGLNHEIVSASMILLGVNIDHCATLRQARYREAGATVGGAVEPDPVAFALAAERAGADGITVHLREDRRHIQDRDVWRVRGTLSPPGPLRRARTRARTARAPGRRPA